MLIKRCLIMKQNGSMYTLKIISNTLKNNHACFESSGKTFNLSVNIIFEKKKNWRERVQIDWPRLTWKGLSSPINMRT